MATHKASKQEAGYVAHSSHNQCQTCENFRNGTCTKVQGAIHPQGTCVKFYHPIKGRK